MKSLLVVSLIALSSQSSVPLHDDLEESIDVKSIQGTWLEKDNQGWFQILLIITGKTFSVRIDDQMLISGNFSIDPYTHPKHIDFKVTAECEQLITKYVGKTIRGIFEVQGETLRFAGEEMRPKSFTEKKGSLIVFERVKR